MVSMMAQWYNCPGCSRVIKYGASPCPHCKGMLDWRQQQPILYLPSDDTQQRFTPITKEEHILGKIQLNKPSKSLSKKQKVALIYVPLSILVVLFGFSSVIAFNKSDDTPLPSNSNSATTKYSPPAYTAPKYTPPTYTPSSNYVTNDDVLPSIPSSSNNWNLPDYNGNTGTSTYIPPTYTPPLSNSNSDMTPSSSSAYTPYTYTPPTYKPPTYTPYKYTPPSYTPPSYADDNENGFYGSSYNRETGNTTLYDYNQNKGGAYSGSSYNQRTGDYTNYNLSSNGNGSYSGTSYNHRTGDINYYDISSGGLGTIYNRRTGETTYESFR